MDCKCADCAAAMASFSVNDLKKITSSIRFDESSEGQNDSYEPATVAVKRKPPAKSGPKAKVEPEPLPEPVYESYTEEEPEHARSPSVSLAESCYPVGSEAGEEFCDTNQACEGLEVSGAGVPGEESLLPPPPPALLQAKMPAKIAAPAIEEEELMPPPPPRVLHTEVSEDDGGMAAGGGDEDGPLEERLRSLNWKSRKSAFEELEKIWEQTYEPDDPSFREYQWALEKMAKDSNANTLEAGLGALIVFADKSSSATSAISSLVPVIIDKALGGRPSTVTRAETLLLKLMEVDTPNAVCEALLTVGLNSKKPKIPPLCASLICKALEAFGAKAMPIKELLSGGKLKAMFESSNAGVRAVAQTLYVDLYKWIGGSPLQSLLNDLKRAQQDALATQVQDITPGQLRPTVYLRKDRPKEGEEPAAAAGAKGKGGDKQAVVDAREFIESVDLISQLAKTDFETKIAETKWSEKVEGLKLVLNIIGPVPKLQPGDYGDLVRTLKGLMSHCHFQVASTAMKVLGLIADGLRKEFHPFSRMVFQAYVSCTKDKKLAAVIGEGLDLLYVACLPLDQVLEDLDTLGLDAKKNSPAGRVCLLEWLGRCAEKPAQKGSLDTWTSITKMVIAKCLGDSDPKLRDASCSALVNIVKLSRRLKPPTGGPVWQVLQQQVENKNPRAFQRIEKESASAGSCADMMPAEPEPKALPPPAPLLKKNSSVMKPKPAEDQPSAPAPPKKKAGSAPAPKTANRPSMVKTRDYEDDDGGADSTANMNPEEAEEYLSGLGIDGWDTVVVPGASSTKWTDKKDALKAIRSFIQEGGAEGRAGEISVPAVIFTKSKTKDFKEPNVNVMEEVYGILTALAEASDESSLVDRRVAALVVSSGCDKFSDKKLKEPVCTMLTTLCEAVGPSWVLGRVIKALTDVKSPAAHVEALVWMNSIIVDFGTSGLNLKTLAAFATGELENTNPKVRSSAVELLGALYHRVGPPLRTIAIPDGLKQASVALIEAEFQKVGFDPASTRQTNRVVKGQEDAGGKAAAPGGGLPRTDLQTLVDKEILTKLQCVEGNKSWQGRKEAMESLIAGCARAGHYVEANKFLAEALKALKPRLVDTQANNKPLAANTIAELIQAIGQESAPRYVKLVVESLLAGVSDNKKVMSNACLEALTKCVTFSDEVQVAGMEAVLPFLSEPLMTKVNRFELLEWVAGRIGVVHGDCVPLVAPLLDAMNDKNVAARAKAEEVMIILGSKGRLTKQNLDYGTRDFNVATKKALAVPLQRIEASFGGRGHPPLLEIKSAPTSPAKSLLSNKKSARSNVPPKGQVVRASTPNLMSSQSSFRKPSQSSMSGDFADDQGSSRPPSDIGEEKEGTSCALKRHSGKAKREAEAKRGRWPKPPEIPGRDEVDLLRIMWEKLLLPEVLNVFFPAKMGSQDCGLPGIDLLERSLDADPDAFVDHLDLIFKWFSLRLAERENVQALQAMLNLMVRLFDMLRGIEGYQLLDFEAHSFVPWILEKAGQPKDRFRLLFRRIMEQICDVYPFSKYVPMVLDGLKSKNTRTKAELLDEVRRIISITPLTVLGKTGVKTVASFLDTREAEVRSAALDCIQIVYESVGADFNKLRKLTGELSGKAMELIQDRIKQLMRTGGINIIEQRTEQAPRTPSRPQSLSATAVQVPQYLRSNSKKKGLTPPDDSSARGRASLGSSTLLMGATDDYHFDVEVPDAPVAGPFGFDDKDDPARSPQTQITEQVSLVGFGTDEAFPYVSDDQYNLYEKDNAEVDEDETHEMYERIAERLDRLLALPQPLNTLCEDYSEGQETLKLLHEIATCIHQERLDLIPKEEIDVFVSQTPNIIPRLTQALKMSFKCAHPKMDYETEVMSEAGGLDFRLFTKAIAALMAALRLPEVVKTLGRVTISNLLETLSLGLADMRLHEKDGPYEANRKKMLEAMNKLVLEVALEAQRGCVFAALFDLLLLCAPNYQGNPPLFSEMVCQILTRIFLKVLKKEMSSDPPFSTMDMQQVVYALHIFFEKYPKYEKEGKPYLAARNLLWNLCQILGSEGMELELQVCAVPLASEVHTLIEEYRQEKENHRHLSNQSVFEPFTSNGHNLEKERDELSRLIDRVAQPQGDDHDAMFDLFRFKKQHPQLDMSSSFAGRTEVFKKHVTRQLELLEMNKHGSGDTKQNYSKDEKEPVMDSLHVLREKLKKHTQAYPLGGPTTQNPSFNDAKDTGVGSQSALRARLESLKQQSQNPHDLS